MTDPAQVKAWREALAARNRQQRRRRWQRAPQVTGVRVPPPADVPGRDQDLAPGRGQPAAQVPAELAGGDSKPRFPVPPGRTTA